MAKPRSSTVLPTLADSRFVRTDWHAVLGLCLLVALFFRDILLQNAFLWEDFLYYYYPARNFAAVSLSHGEIPLWNPYTFNGMPFQADIQTAILYIPNLILTLFVSGDRLNCYWFELMIVLHYMLAAVSMYYLAKSLGLERPVAFFSGLAFSLSGYFITRAIHQPILYESAWFPLIVLLFRRTLLERSWRWMIVTGLLLGHTVLAGFPQMSLYIYYLLLVIFLFEWFHEARAGSLRASVPTLALAAGCIVISLAAAAVQLLPTVELAPFTQRAEMTYAKSIEGSLPWSGLLLLIIPKFFGASGAQGSTVWNSSFYGQYWESCIYLGIAVLGCLLFALPLLRRQRIVALLSGLFLFGLLYVLGDSFVLHKLFFYAVPGFNTFRDPGRMSFVIAFAAALLAGYGLQHFLATAGEHRTLFRRLTLALAGAGILAWALANAGSFQPSGNPQFYAQVHPLVSSEATTALILVILTCSLLWLFLAGKLSTTTFLLALVALQFVDMNIFGFSQNNSELNPGAYYARPAQLVSMLKEAGKTETFRINARQGGAMLLDRNQGMMDRIFMMEGYSSLVLQRINPPGKDWAAVRDLMNSKYYIVVDEKKREMSMGTSSSYLPRAYVVHDARIIKEDSAQKAFMNSDAFRPDRTVVLEEEIPFTLNDTTLGSRAAITAYSTNAISLDVTAAAPGVLCLSEVYFPGWNAYVDGVQRHLYRSNWNQRAVLVEGGHHTVEIRFEPESFTRGAWISAITLGLCLLAFFGVPLLGRSRGNAA